MRSLSLFAVLLLSLPSPARAVFYAAAGKIEITPDVRKHKALLAGFGATGRPIKAIHDPLYARGIVVSDGTRTYGFIAVEVLGLYREEIEAIRRQALENPARESLLVAATHTHSGPDTIGLWGPYLGVFGVDHVYQAYLRERVAALYKDLKSRLQEAEIVAATKELDPHGLVRDVRDPRIIDAELRVLHFRSRSKGKAPIGTLVNWSCHAETLGDGNRSLSADFPGEMCANLEKDMGTCAFFPGAIGGLMTPDKHSDTVADEYRESRRIGLALAGHVRALAKKGAVVRPDAIRQATRTVRVPIENPRYLLFLPKLMFGHKVYAPEGGEMGRFAAHWYRLRQLVWPHGPEDLPFTETEVSSIRLGPIQIFAEPGELFPELYLGGYDGRYSYGTPIITPDNRNPPDLSKAPKGPYLRDFMTGRYKLIFGLANDMVGYIVPAYDFKSAGGRFMLPRLPGHHYEETNSIGKESSARIVEAAREVLEDK